MRCNERSPVISDSSLPNRERVMNGMVIDDIILFIFIFEMVFLVLLLFIYVYYPSLHDNIIRVEE